MVEEKPIKTLICIVPGLMRDSICTLLASFSEVICIGASLEPHAFLHEVDQYQPDVILFEYASNYHNLELICNLENTTVDIKCVVLADNFSQTMPKMKEGVEYLLKRGFTGRDLKAIIQEVYRRKKYRLTETNSTDPTH